MLKYETLLFVSGSATVALSRALSLSLCHRLADALNASHHQSDVGVYIRYLLQSFGSFLALLIGLKYENDLPSPPSRSGTNTVTFHLETLEYDIDIEYFIFS